MTLSSSLYWYTIPSSPFWWSATIVSSEPIICLGGISRAESSIIPLTINLSVPLITYTVKSFSFR